MIFTHYIEHLFLYLLHREFPYLSRTKLFLYCNAMQKQINGLFNYRLFNYSVQETDGSFFESFTALSWKQENRRLVVLQEVEARAKEPPPPSRDSSLTSQPYRLSKKEVKEIVSSMQQFSLIFYAARNTSFVYFITKILRNFSNRFQFLRTVIFRLLLFIIL